MICYALKWGDTQMFTFIFLHYGTDPKPKPSLFPMLKTLCKDYSKNNPITIWAPALWRQFPPVCFWKKPINGNQSWAIDIRK